MRLLCPHCSQSIAIADTEAGKPVSCPLCAQSFPAPELYAVSMPDPLPLPLPATTTPTSISLIGAPESPQLPSEPKPSSQPKIEGRGRVLSISLHPATMQWLAPICLTLALVLTFFKWTGSFPAGYAAYTQNAWQALFGTMSADPVSDKLFEMEATLKDRLASSWWLLPYLILLIPAVVLVWAHHLVNRGRLQLPTLLQSIWSIRLALLAAMAGILLFVLLIQVVAGFGLEHAVSSLVSESLKEETKLAKTPEEIQRVQMQIAREVGKYQLGNTIWLWLAIVMHLLALVGIAAETAMQQRGDKPPPRVGIFW